jgi:hypothetical protein
VNPNTIHLENLIHPSETFEENVELDVGDMDVELAIRKLKNYKVPGPDGLVYKLICEIWTKEEMPVDWKVGGKLNVNCIKVLYFQ